MKIEYSALRRFVLLGTVVGVIGLLLLPIQSGEQARLPDQLAASPVYDWLDWVVDWMSIKFNPFFKAVAGLLAGLQGLILRALVAVPSLRIQVGGLSIQVHFLIIVAALLAFSLSTVEAAITIVIGFSAIAAVGLWSEALVTLSLTLAASLVIITLGMPVGIVAGKNNTVESMVRPFLDFMQTISAFVYLIPAVMFFGLGIPSAMFATIVFASPPIIRLTSLGIRHLPLEVVEAANAFGHNRLEVLWKIELPLARPSLMTGVNQTIMLALSMTVVAALVGGRGLGSEIVTGIQRLDIGRGFVGGFCVATLAMILDRSTRQIGARKPL